MAKPIWVSDREKIQQVAPYFTLDVLRRVVRIRDKPIGYEIEVLNKGRKIILRKTKRGVTVEDPKGKIPAIIFSYYGLRSLTVWINYGGASIFYAKQKGGVR